MKQDLILEQLIRIILLEQPGDDDLFGGDQKDAVPINTAKDEKSAQEIIDAGLADNNMNFDTDTTFLETVALENSEKYKDSTKSEEEDSILTDLLADFFSTWVSTAAISVGFFYLLYKFKVLKQITVIGPPIQALYDGIIHTIIGKQSIKATPNIPTKLKQHFWLLFNRRGVDMLASTTYGKFLQAAEQLRINNKITYAQEQALIDIIGKTEIKLLISKIQLDYAKKFVAEIKAGKISLEKWENFGSAMKITTKPEFIAIKNELKYVETASKEIQSALKTAAVKTITPAITINSYNVLKSTKMTKNAVYDNIMKSSYFKQKYNPNELDFRNAMETKGESRGYLYGIQSFLPAPTAYNRVSIPKLYNNIQTILKHGNVKFPSYKQFPKQNEWFEQVFDYSLKGTTTSNYAIDTYKGSYANKNANYGSEYAKELYDAYKYIWKYLK